MTINVFTFESVLRARIYNCIVVVVAAGDCDWKMAGSNPLQTDFSTLKNYPARQTQPTLHMSNLYLH